MRGVAGAKLALHWCLVCCAYVMSAYRPCALTSDCDVGADLHRATVATVPGEKLVI